MADDWDLQAVVRGCTTNAVTSCSSNTTATAAVGGATISTSRSGCDGDVDCSFGSFEPQRGGNYLSFQDLLFEPRNTETGGGGRGGGGIQELDDLYKPFFPKSSPPVSPQNNMPISPLSVLGGLQDLSSQQHPQKQFQQIYQPKNRTLSMGGGSRTTGASSSSSSHNPSPRSKRRKNQMKRVCQVPSEALSSDMWSWRKYGQKPIKGSPYPRGYYRCSTSKGCLARKQVERNRSDPGMFIVTYTAEHNHPMPTHRNSLAGSTRQKPATTQTGGNSDNLSSKNGGGGSSSPPVSPSVSLSPVPTDRLEFESSKDEIMEDEDDDINAPEMPLEDDFFEGLEELTEKSAVDCFPDHFPPPQSMQFPWLSNKATTTAAGGG